MSVTFILSHYVQARNTFPKNKPNFDRQQPKFIKRHKKTERGYAFRFLLL